MDGRSWTSEPYRFGYQGQFSEYDEETGWNAFELRMYDNRVGRWLSVDPEKQFSSPYLGMGNKPIIGNDSDGSIVSPFPLYFGRFRHLLGPDAVEISINIDAVGPTHGVDFSPIGAILVLRGPDTGTIKIVGDAAFAQGLDFSATIQLTEYYFNGELSDLTEDRFEGFRMEGNVAVSVGNLDLGTGLSYAPDLSEGFLEDAIFGVNYNIGVGEKFPFDISGNINYGWTYGEHTINSIESFLELIKEELSRKEFLIDQNAKTDEN